MSKDFKEVLLKSLAHLSEQKKISVYAFVLMPNHVHLIWELLAKNGKEYPHASFMKYTSHEFLRTLRDGDIKSLASFEVEKASRKHQFWQRNALATELYTPAVAYQKLDYIHNNPCQGKWMLADSPIEYDYSSAKFYEDGIDNFGFLTHIGEKF